MRALFAVVLSALLCTCTSKPSLLDQITAEGQLRVITRNSPTTFYYGPTEPKGIEYELALGFAKRLGIELAIQVADQFGEILPAVAGRRAHIGAAGLTVTRTREGRVDFGPAYQTTQQQVIYRRGTARIRSLEDMLGKRIEVLADSAYVRTLDVAQRDFPGLQWRENSEVGVEELVARVARGEIDYTIVDSNIFKLLRQYHPEARVAFNVGRVSPIAWAIPPGETGLREAISAYFAEIRATGELDEILDRHYFAARNFDYVGSRSFVRHVKSRLPQYRAYFQEAAQETGFEWRLLAAIAYQESHWNPKAVSPTGVRGMMMLTEQAANFVNVSDRHDARESIIGGAHYLSEMLDKIPERIQEPDRLWMALAAYNIGYGHLEDARVITEILGTNPDAWQDVREKLPLLTDEKWFSRVRRGYARGDVAAAYVDNVRRYYELLHWIVDDDVQAQDREPEVDPGPAMASVWSLFNVLP